MGVIFDEVTGSVAAPPQPPEQQREPEGEEPSTPCEERRWQQRLASFLRRQQRLEAD